MNTIDLVNSELEPVNLNVNKLIKWSLHDYTVKPVCNDVDHKLKSCVGVADIKTFCHQVMQENIDSRGYMFNERNHFATVEFNAEEFKYIKSVVVNCAINDWVVEDKTIPKSDTVRLKLIDLKNLIVLGTKETLKLLRLARKPDTNKTSSNSHSS